jgi:hypothetical protein
MDAEAIAERARVVRAWIRSIGKAIKRGRLMVERYPELEVFAAEARKCLGEALGCAEIGLKSVADSAEAKG